jgi:hypothetical protein
MHRKSSQQMAGRRGSRQSGALEQLRLRLFWVVPLIYIHGVWGVPGLVDRWNEDGDDKLGITARTRARLPYSHICPPSDLDATPSKRHHRLSDLDRLPDRAQAQVEIAPEPDARVVF